VVIITFFSVAVCLILLFTFITGFHDEGSLIATIITSRSVKIRMIFTVAFFSQFLGTMFLGTKVAVNTVTSLLDVRSIQSDRTALPMMICAAMGGAIIWDLVTWVLQIPSSSSHAVVGGLLGAFLFHYGPGVVCVKGLLLGVLLPLFTSPLIGFVLGFLFYRINQRCFCGCKANAKKPFCFSQITTSALINAFQGSNDAQKSMGVFALLWLAVPGSRDLHVFKNFILWTALAISLGLLLGGMKMIQSVGTKIFSVQILHSISAQTSAMAVIVSSSLLGFPISGTQIVNSAILGVGAADRPNAVGWAYAKSMLITWGTTIPASLIISGGLYCLLQIIA
jgi:PiT family inorganic phosphate transporter